MTAKAQDYLQSPSGTLEVALQCSKEKRHVAGMQAVDACKREDFVGICGFSSLDWVTADFANTYCGERQ